MCDFFFGRFANRFNNGASSDLQRRGTTVLRRRPFDLFDPVEHIHSNANALFFSQLSTLYEVKPPISKAKMNSITKTAIKAIKMYKHIVQSVERFIIKVSLW